MWSCGDKSPTPLRAAPFTSEPSLCAGSCDFISLCLPSSNCRSAPSEFEWHLEILLCAGGSGLDLGCWRGQRQLQQGPGQELVDATLCLADPRQWPFKSSPVFVGFVISHGCGSCLGSSLEPGLLSPSREMNKPRHKWCVGMV